MKRSLPHLGLLAIAVLLAAGCGDDTASQPPAPEQDQGRKETQKVLAADAVGYDGKAIRKSVDKVLDENDRRNKQIEEAAQAGETKEPEK